MKTTKRSDFAKIRRAAENQHKVFLFSIRSSLVFQTFLSFLMKPLSKDALQNVGTYLIKIECDISAVITSDTART